MIQRKAETLTVVVVQNRRADLVGDFGEQAVTFRQRRDLPLLDEVLHENLEVDLVVRAVDTARIVDRIAVDPAAGQGIFDSPPLG